MSLKELYTEYDYRISERLGILCEDRRPTPEQLAIAEAEARQWLRQMTGPAEPEQLNLLR